MTNPNTPDTLALNTVNHGDCLDLMRLIPTQSVDMVMCDLPYGTTACKWDAIIPFDPLWAEYNRIITPGGAIVLTASQPFTTALIGSNIRRFKHTWVWNKRFAGNFATARYAPMKIHEDVCVFSGPSGKITYQPLMTKRDTPIKLGGNRCASDSAKISANSRIEGLTKTYDEKFPESILLYPRERGLHPTQKPVGLFEYLIRTYSPPGGTILDNCLGSGTTAIAAINSGRNWIGIEQDAHYVEVARQRIAAHLASKERS